MRTIRKITAVLLTAAMLLTFAPLTFAADETREDYIKAIEILYCYYKDYNHVLRIDSVDNLRKCISKLEIRDKTENCIVRTITDAFSSNEYPYDESLRGFNDLNFYFLYDFKETSEYDIIIPADAFYPDLCEEYSVPVPEEDYIFEFSGEEIFAQDFTPFFMPVLGDRNYGARGKHDGAGAVVDFGNEKSAYLIITPYVTPSWDREMEIKASYSSGFDEFLDITFNGEMINLKHYNGKIYFGLFDVETGELYDTICVQCNSRKQNTPATFRELLEDTFYPDSDILMAPFAMIFMVLMGMVMLPVDAVLLTVGFFNSVFD